MIETELNLPLGGDFLKVVRDQEHRCAESFDEWLPQAGIKAPQTMDALGTALSYLDRIASCWWGCRKGTHAEERLVGRVASNTRAALGLLRTGYYDEALGLVRQIGETANLACLFVQSPESHEKWKDASEKVARKEFSPVKVRRLLEDLPLPLPMDQDTYGLLSRQFVHVNPETSPQNHNPFSLPTLGGYFQEVGALLSLNHLGGMVGWVLWLAVDFIKPPTDKKAIADASLSLLRSIGAVDLNSVQDHFEGIRESPQTRGTWSG
ncbi:MAG: hypothetical protein OXC98_08285 [bacterium]|nr:hypothetical protein [Acidimicrobiia bacterium]MCY4650351.1 hypothetical protein [bacterium]